MKFTKKVQKYETKKKSLSIAHEMKHSHTLTQFFYVRGLKKIEIDYPREESYYVPNNEVLPTVTIMDFEEWIETHADDHISTQMGRNLSVNWA